MNKVQCEKCEVCETTENVKYYETSNQNWCEVCAEQIACPECGCWYFAEDGLVCSGCAVDESEDNGDDECYECGASESVEQCSECDKIFCPCHGPHYHYLTEPDEIYCDSCVESLKKRRLLSVGQPEFLDLMWGVIDNSPRLQDAKYIIRMKYRELLPFTTDDVIDRSARLYHLSKKLKGHLKRRKDTNKLYFK